MAKTNEGFAMDTEKLKATQDKYNLVMTNELFKKLQESIDSGEFITVPHLDKPDDFMKWLNSLDADDLTTD